METVTLRRPCILDLTSGNPSDFCIMQPLVPVVKSWEKNWGHQKNLGQSGGLSFKGSDGEKRQF